MPYLFNCKKCGRLINSTINGYCFNCFDPDNDEMYEDVK